MSGPYRIFGAELSPYSVKVRAYARYKNLNYQWLPRTGQNAPEFTKYAKMPLVPLLVLPNDEAIQDSTLIMEGLDRLHPQTSTHPGDPALAFVSLFLEELGDEWGNKWMFHYRWKRELDQRVSASRIALSMNPELDEAAHDALTQQVSARMVSRVWFVGSSEANTPLIEQSFHAALAQLDQHLAGRAYLFGARPSFGDFGVWAQFYEIWTDPTGAAIINARAPRVLNWIHRMLWPQAHGAFEAWSTLESTLAPILHDWGGELFMPWTVANANAIAQGLDVFSVTLRGANWTQKPQKYHARSLAALRLKYQAVGDRRALDAILDRAKIKAGLDNLMA